MAGVPMGGIFKPQSIWSTGIDLTTDAIRVGDNIVPDIANISDNIVGDVVRPGYLDDVAEVITRDIGVYGREMTPVYDDLIGAVADDAWGLTNKIDTGITNIPLVAGRETVEIGVKDIGVVGRETVETGIKVTGRETAETGIRDIGSVSKIDTGIKDIAVVTGRETVETGIKDIGGVSAKLGDDLTGAGIRDIGGVSAKVAPDLTGTGIRDIGGVSAELGDDLTGAGIRDIGGAGREVAETGLKDATKPGLISKVVGAGEDVTSALGKVTGFVLEHKLAAVAVGGLGLGVLYLGSAGGGSDKGGSNANGDVSICVGLSGPELAACQNKNTYKAATGTGTGSGKDICDINSAALGNSFSSCKTCLSTLNLTGKTSITASEQTALQSCINLAGPGATGTGGKGATGTGTGTGAGGKGATGTGGGGGGNTPGNICDLSGLTAPDLAKCKSCLTTLQLPDVTLTMGVTDKAKLQACMNSATGTGGGGGGGNTPGNICDLTVPALSAAGLAICKSCLTTLQLSDITPNMPVADKSKLQSCITAGGSATGSGGGGGANICDVSGLSATGVATCKSCITTLQLPDPSVTMSPADKAKLQGCISGGGSATGSGPGPTGPGPAGTDMCDVAGLTAEQKLICKMCQQQGFTAEDSLKMCYACNTQSNIVSAGLAATCTSCVKSGNVTTDSLATCLKAHPDGGTGTTPTAATAAEVAAMAAATAAGKNPCSASGLSAAVQSACSQCYQTGMTETQLVACVNGKLVAAAGGTGAVAVATLKKYAIPIALGVAVVGGVAYATHGKYWGKKGTGKMPVKYVPPKPIKPRHK